ncbi:MAG: SprB repeat-containing protein, partial [Flavobacteriales bacterium]|nr:SprB repeat-containing protein [Flavobacteriales bacterium]
ADHDTLDVAGISKVTQGGLCANAYLVTVTDDAGCPVTIADVITEPAAALTITDSIAQITCFDEADGAIALVRSGGTGLVTYTWSSPHSDFSISGLVENNYAVTVTDANLCTVTADWDILEPTEILFDLTMEQTHCEMNDGIVISETSGGEPSYEYLWAYDAANTTGTASDVGEGDYFVTVSDITGCTAENYVTVTQVSKLRVILDTLVHNSCFGICDGYIEVHLEGGTPDANGNYPDLHTWTQASGNNGSLTATDLCGASGGGNQIDGTFYDEAGCSVPETWFIVTPAKLILNTVIQDSIICIGESAQVTAEPSGGTFPYTFIWPSDEILTASSGAHIVEPVVTTGYFVSVTDLNGCGVSETLTVNVREPLEVTLSPTKTVCDGDTVDLVATAVGGLGAPNYVFTWEAESGSPTVDVASGSTSTLRIIPEETIIIDVVVNDGCTVEPSVEAEEVVNVNITPLAVLTPDTAGCSPLNVCFVNRTVMEITGFTFNYEPGASYSTTDVEDTETCYTFENNSVFNTRDVTVELIASNNGCSTTATVDIEV